jgi:hypothetical protein
VEETLNRGQSLIASRNTVSPVVLQVLKKRQHCFHIQIVDGEPGQTALGAKISDQEFECVAVTFQRVGTHAPLIKQVGVEEGVKLKAQVHDQELERLGWGTTSSNIFWNLLSPSRKSARVTVKYTCVFSILTCPM